MGRQILKVFVLALFLFTPGKSQEPACSKFDYEMRTLEAMLRMEQKVEKMVEEMKIKPTVYESLTQRTIYLVLKEAVSTEVANSQSFRERAKVDLDEKKTAIDELINSKSTELDAKMESLTQKTEVAVQNIDETLKSNNDVTIAFSVTTPTLKLVDGVATFTEVITNIGEAYDLKTGVFTSPVEGVFAFLFIVGSQGSYQVHCRIQHNGIDKVLGLTNSDTAFTTAAAGVNLLLKKGDTVRLGHCHNWNHAYHSYKGTSFSGVLIKQTSSR